MGGGADDCRLRTPRRKGWGAKNTKERTRSGQEGGGWAHKRRGCYAEAGVQGTGRKNGEQFQLKKKGLGEPLKCIWTGGPGALSGLGREVGLAA